MRHARLFPADSPGTIYEDLTPEARDADWVAETRPDLAPLVPLPEPPAPALTGEILPPPDTERHLSATLALAYLVGKVTALEATGGEGPLDAYVKATRCDTMLPVLEAAAAGDLDAEREFCHATAGSRSMRNLRPYRDYHDAITDAAAIVRYAPGSGV